MDILIIGYGSAGKRHAKILSSFKLVKNIFIKTNQNINSRNKIKFIKKINNINPDLIIVANETYKHFETCKLLEKKYKRKIIITEKPLFHKYFNFRPKNNKFFVTYNLRFHPCLKYIKKKFNLSKTFYVEAESSSYVPKWRKKTDYRKNYSAFSKKGGGVILDLSHEIDYIMWLFPHFKIQKILKKKISNLKIFSEDFALILGKIKKDQLIKIKLTYFNKSPRRSLIICLKNDIQIYADLIKSKIKIYKKNSFRTINLKQFSQNETTTEMYKCILNNNFKNICSFMHGLDILKQIKYSHTINY